MIAGNYLFGFFALAHGCIALGALSLSADLLLPAFCLFVVEAVTAFDNGATVLGRRLGVSEQAKTLNRYRFLLHATCIGLLVPVYGGIGAELAFSGVGEAVAISVCWMLAVAIGLYGYFYQYRGLGVLMPVNYLGCLRYAQSCNESTRWPGYEYTEAELNTRAILPVASIITTLIGLIISLLIGWFGSFWVPCIVTALMFTAGAFPQRGWGPVATSGLEIIFSSGMLYSLWYAANAAALSAS